MRNLKLLGLVGSVCALLLFISCHSSSTPSAIARLCLEQSLDTDASSGIQEKIEVVSLIPLETSDTVLLADIRKIVMADDLLFILDTEFKLRVFDMQGGFVREIGREGQGPEEYSMLTDFTIDKDRKEVLINGMMKIVVYDFEGNFKRNVGLKDENLQVFTYCNDKLFYIFPDKKHAEGVVSAPLISVLGLDGALLKELPAHQLRRVGDIPFFNNIATDGTSVFYKEEMGQILYAIRDDFAVDSVCVLDLGKYAFKPEDFEFSKHEIWAERYRLQNILPTNDFMVFILQKGLMGEEFEPFVWDRSDNTLQRFDYKVSYKGNDLLVMPYAVLDNRLIGVVAATEDEVEGDNPVVAILGID